MSGEFYGEYVAELEEALDQEHNPCNQPQCKTCILLSNRNTPYVILMQEVGDLEITKTSRNAVLKQNFQQKRQTVVIQRADLLNVIVALQRVARSEGL